MGEINRLKVSDEEEKMKKNRDKKCTRNKIKYAYDTI